MTKAPHPDAKRQFRRFADFYPYYLQEHSLPMTRRLHFVGTTLVILTVAYALVTGRYRALWLLPLFGYGFAWFAHFAYEKNRPATFTYPLYSLMGDFAMYRDLLLGRLKF